MAASKPSRPVKKAVSPRPARQNAARAAKANAAARQVQTRIARQQGDASPTTDWRIERLEQLRQVILSVDPAIVEERKWIKPTNPAGVAVWSLNGILCTGEMYKGVVKLTFFKGASLPDPRSLFNAGLDGGTRRAIDLREGEKINTAALKALIKAAIAENSDKSAVKVKPAVKEVKVPAAAAKKMKSKPARDDSWKSKLKRDEKTGVVLLSGGNPQIAKADGDAPVQAYIAAMPGWKSLVGRRIDELITEALPNVNKAVRWNSPFYGIDGKGWIISFHVLTKYVKVTFFAGKSLDPIPPGGTPKSGESRWIDIYETDKLDEAQFTSWVKQAAAIPGWLA